MGDDWKGEANWVLGIGNGNVVDRSKGAKEMRWKMASLLSEMLFKHRTQKLVIIYSVAILPDFSPDETSVFSFCLFSHILGL